MDDQLLVGKRVLVVEDEMLVLLGIQDMLTDLGCKSIAVAGDVGTALGAIAADTFDLVTLDVNLQGTRSYAVADALRGNDIPFAFLTGYSAHGVDQRFARCAVLTKPYTCLQFEQVIGELLMEGASPC